MPCRGVPVSRRGCAASAGRRVWPHAGVGVVNRMAEIGITVSHAVEQPEPRHASAEEASLLGVQKGALVTHIRRTYYSDQGQPVETADIVIPSALCEVVYEIPVSR